MMVSKRKLVFAKTDGRCYYCGDEIEFKGYHIDHVTPKSRGGSCELSNLVPSCHVCNVSKGTLNLNEFREKLESLCFSDDIRYQLLFRYYHVEYRPKITFYFEKVKTNVGNVMD